MILLFLFSPNFCIKAFYIYFDSRTQGLFSAQPKCKNNCAATPPSKFDVENEFHFLMCCKQYDHLRSVLFKKLSCPQFNQMNDQILSYVNMSINSSSCWSIYCGCLWCQTSSLIQFLIDIYFVLLPFLFMFLFCFCFCFFFNQNFHFSVNF